MNVFAAPLSIRPQSGGRSTILESHHTYQPGTAGLILGLKKADPAALEVLYDWLAPKALGLAHRILGSDQVAEDAVQEAFLTVWRQADRLDTERGNIEAYLMTVVHHKAIDAARAMQRRTLRQLPLDPDSNTADTTDVTGEVTRSLDEQAIRRSLTELPDLQRQVVEMAYFAGLTYVEIAEAIGAPVGTVKSRMRLALQQLRGLLRREVLG